MTRAGAPVGRVGQLLEAVVYDAKGEPAGQVHDVRLVRTGPDQGLFGPGYRVDGLVVGPASVGDRLGFDRTDMPGPWALKALFAAFHRSARFVPWPLVESVTQTEVHPNVARDQLPTVPPLTE